VGRSVRGRGDFDQRARALLEPFAGTAVAQGRELRQRAAGGRGVGGLRSRHLVAARAPRGPRLPHRVALVLRAESRGAPSNGYHRRRPLCRTTPRFASRRAPD
jgi:hypothetical protein